ncbi:MAG: hypothetical protein HS132_18155 [Planctomycetia bacterium]|nr:hypothetical protein [Planctomycetia bacterium]
MKEIVYIELGDTVLENHLRGQAQSEIQQPGQVGCRGIALEVDNMATAVNYPDVTGIAMAQGYIDTGNSFRGDKETTDGLIIELRQWK